MTNRKKKGQKRDTGNAWQGNKGLVLYRHQIQENQPKGIEIKAFHHEVSYASYLDNAIMKGKSTKLVGR